jgi:hippurate hydrolase
MASSDYAIITVHGNRRPWRHAAPAADPVVAAASLVMALQTIVSRNVDPLQMAVVTVGACTPAEANNVIPARPAGAERARARPRRARAAEQRITALAQRRRRAYGVRAEVDYRPGYAVLVNTPAETAFAREVALELLGAERVTLQGPPLTGSEDFAFMLERVPGSYLLIGNGEGETRASGGCMVHNPGYDFNDAILPIAASYWVQLVRRFLAPAS